MNIYNPYTNTIREAMNKGVVNENLSSFDGTMTKSKLFSEMKKQIPDNSLLPGMQELSNQLGVIPNFNQKTGNHPDFSQLKENGETENHYIVSMFIDIKGSTNLFKKYDPLTVMVISNTIQKAAIHTCLTFGGYVHRLQGDGLFVYFGGKNISKETATERSLQAAAFFSYFMRNDLKVLLNEQGIENIYTRIGIDLGHDADVVWALAGIGEISEVTTCSLHTSLAAKMQAKAESNGVVIGDNIKSTVNELDTYFTTVCSRKNDENERYIFRNDSKLFYYTQYDFQWYKYLRSLKFIATDLDGRLALKANNPVILNNRNIQNLRPIAEKSKPYFNF